MIGFRLWVVREDEALEEGLKALSGTYRWKRGENEAICNYKPSGGPDNHVPAEPKCTCGFWAFWKQTDLYEQAIEEGGGWQYDVYVLGQIEAWGRVQKHSKGFRAQFAQVTAIFEPSIVNGKMDPVIQIARAIETSLFFNVPMKRIRVHGQMKTLEMKEGYILDERTGLWIDRGKMSF